MKIKTHFYNDEARKYYNSVIKSFEDYEFEHIDRDDIVMLCNLRSQRIELEKAIKEEGFTAVNENSRGGRTYQVHPAYRAYISCVGEIGKTINRIKRSIPSDKDDYFDEEFENF